ncbi:TPA: glycosyltransferase [Photobacterium damselae]
MLTLSISTTNKNITKLIENLDKYSFPDFITINIICQNLCKENNFELPPSNYNIYKYNEKGISKSRNRGIEVCSTEYIWFMDDDVQYSIKDLKGIFNIFEDNNECYLIKIRSLEDKRSYYKKYVFDNYMSNKIQALKVSSIEIICNVKFLREKMITFKEDIGLGTDYPCCEENNFILDILDNKGKVFYTNLAPVYHTTLEHNRLSPSPGHLRARGELLKRFSLIYRLPLILRWARRDISGITFYNRFYLLIKGIY